MFKRSFKLLFLVSLFSFSACGTNPGQTNFSNPAAGNKAGSFKVSSTDYGSVSTFSLEGVIFATIQLIDVINENGNTTLTYSITSNPDGGNAVSHIVLAMEDCFSSDVLVSSNDPQGQWIETDPTTGVTGIKLNTGYDNNETRTVTITLKGTVEIGDITTAVKAGNRVTTGTLKGPICSVAQPEPTATAIPTPEPTPVPTPVPTPIPTPVPTPVPTPPPAFCLNGITFVDFNKNGQKEMDEPPVPGVPVILNTGAKTISDEKGFYGFPALKPGDYTVSIAPVPGLMPVTPVNQPVKIIDREVKTAFFFQLDRNFLGKKPPNVFPVNFWLNNINNALVNNPAMMQISPANLNNFTGQIGAFSLPPYSALNLTQAKSILSDPLADPAVQLRKQLLASEYNLMNGAFVGGNKLYTSLFLWEGEYILVNGSKLSPTQLQEAKNRYEFFNNPAPGPLPSCTM
jgi:hypothetical protein